MTALSWLIVIGFVVYGLHDYVLPWLFRVARRHEARQFKRDVTDYARRVHAGQYYDRLRARYPDVLEDTLWRAVVCIEQAGVPPITDADLDVAMQWAKQYPDETAHRADVQDEAVRQGDYLLGTFGDYPPAGAPKRKWRGPDD